MPARLFFSTLFQKIPINNHILLWQGEIRRSTWCRSVDEAAQKVDQLADEPYDLYCGCCLSPQDYGPKARGDAKDVSAIPAMWLDIDIHYEHSKAGKHYPPNYETAAKLVNLFPLKPTMIVSSGHGFHFWWVLDKLWVFENHGQREQAAKMMFEFIRTFKWLFQKEGYSLDSVFDLSRVLRPPGTYNRKHGAKLPVFFYQEPNDERLYSIFEINKALTDFQEAIGYTPDFAEPGKAPLPLVQGGQYVLNPDAEPPPAKLAILLTDEKFLATWEMRRPDMNDQTPSAYEMSLANFAVKYEWPWQEAIDLMISWRRRHGFEPKLREKRYIDTLLRAQASMRKHEAEETLKKMVEHPPDTDEVPRQQQRQVLRNNLSELIGIPIIRIVQYVANDDATFKIECPGVCFKIGSVKNLTNLNLFRDHIAENMHRWLNTISKEMWNNVVVPALLAACELDYLGHEASVQGMVSNWLHEYLQQVPLEYDPDSAVVFGRPFCCGTNLYLFGSSLRSFLSSRRYDNVTAKSMAIALKEYGFSSRIFHFTINGKQTTRNVWGIHIKDHSVAPHINEDTLDDANRKRELVKGSIYEDDDI